jgi:hypothetical protein
MRPFSVTRLQAVAGSLVHADAAVPDIATVTTSETIVGVVDPVTATNTEAQGILSQQNDCSTYFDAGAGTFSAGTQTSAALFLASDNVQSINNLTFTTVGGTSTQGTGQGSTITMNLNSPFMLPVQLQNGGPPVIYTVGSFVSASPQGKAGMLFHELAHTLNMIPRDGGNTDQSIRNTRTIMEHCEAAIRSYFQYH